MSTFLSKGSVPSCTTAGIPTLSSFSVNLRLSPPVRSCILSKISGFDPIKDTRGINEFIEHVALEAFEILVMVMQKSSVS